MPRRAKGTLSSASCQNHIPESRVSGIIRRSFTGVRIRSKASALPAASALLFRYRNQESAPYAAACTAMRAISLPKEDRYLLPYPAKYSRSAALSRKKATTGEVTASSETSPRSQ